MYIAHELLLRYVAAASIEATQRHGVIHRGRAASSCGRLCCSHFESIAPHEDAVHAKTHT
jgi:hypothetical protein